MNAIDTEVYEYGCRRMTDGEYTEDGLVGSACGQPAAAVSIGNDEGVCLSCLREMRVADAGPLDQLPDVIEALSAEAGW